MQLYVNWVSAVIIKQIKTETRFGKAKLKFQQDLKKGSIMKPIILAMKVSFDLSEYLV